MADNFFRTLCDICVHLYVP